MALVCSLYIVNNLLILPSPCCGNTKQQGHTQRHTPLSPNCIQSVYGVSFEANNSSTPFPFCLGKYLQLRMLREMLSCEYGTQSVALVSVFYTQMCGCCPPDLAEEQVELLARAVVSSLGQEELDLLLNLLFIQMPAVLIIDAGSRCGVRGPQRHTLMERHTSIRLDALPSGRALRCVAALWQNFRHRVLCCVSQHSLA